MLMFLQINKNGVRKFTYFCFSSLKLVRFLVELEAGIEAARPTPQYLPVCKLGVG